MNECVEIASRPMDVICDEGVCPGPGNILIGTSQMYIHLMFDEADRVRARKTVPAIARLRKNGLNVTRLGAPSRDDNTIFVMASGEDGSFVVEADFDLGIKGVYQAPDGCLFYCPDEGLAHSPEGFWARGPLPTEWLSTVSTEPREGNTNHPGAFSSFQRLPSGALLAAVREGTSLWRSGLYEIDIDRWVGARGMDFVHGEWSDNGVGGAYAIDQTTVLVPHGRSLQVLELRR